MEIVRSDGPSGPGRVEGPRLGSVNPAASVPLSARGDRVEISEAARLSSAVARVPDVRTEKIRNLRDVIARGDYESEEKFRIAVERFLDELDGA